MSRSQTNIAPGAIGFDDLVALLGSIFIRHGASETVAAVLADNCARCERDGATSHGVFRMPGYVATLKSGWVDARAVARIEDAAPGIVRVDAMNGFAQPALAAARPLLLEKVAQSGIAMLAMRNSHHFSALWADVEPFAEQGLFAMSFVNSFACTVPHGGHSAVFGTNPLAFAAPRAGGPPVVADLATSAISNGDVQIAAREGAQLPPGYGVDRLGSPTTDPRAILDGGALLTFGGHKGSAISLMIELLGAALTGGNFSFEVDWSNHEGAQTPHTGQVIIVMDPDRGAVAPFAKRTEQLLDRLSEAGMSRVPGDRRYKTRALSDSRGIIFEAGELARLEALASS